MQYRGAYIDLSEPVVVSTKCKQCRKETEIYKSAYDLYDVITFCGICCKQSNEVKYVHELSFNEFAATFRDKEVPVKYVKKSQWRGPFIRNKGGLIWLK